MVLDKIVHGYRHGLFEYYFCTIVTGFQVKPHGFWSEYCVFKVKTTEPTHLEPRVGFISCDLDHLVGKVEKRLV